jgi:tight adherence protein B
VTLAIIFVFALVLCTGIYLGVYSYFDKRDAGEVHSRLAERAKSVPNDGTSGPSQKGALFGGGSVPKNIGGRIMTWFNMDRRLHQMAEQAGVEWLPGQIVMGCLGLAFVAFNLGWYMLPPGMRYVGFIAAIGGGSLPLLYLRRARRKRVDAFEAQFPDALLFIARAMRAGHAFSVSLDLLQKEFDKPLSSEFHIVFEEQNLGLPIDIALEKLAKRMPMLDVRFFVAAVILQKRTGGNLGEILEKLAGLIRERFKLRGQIRTISAHGRMSSAVLTGIPVVVSIMMYFVNRDHMMFFVEEEIGQWMAGLAVAFVCAGFLIMRQIVKIEV